MSYHDDEFKRIDAAMARFNAHFPEFRKLATPLNDVEPIRRNMPAGNGGRPKEVQQRIDVRRNGGAGSPGRGEPRPGMVDLESNPRAALGIALAVAIGTVLWIAIGGVVWMLGHPEAGAKIVAGIVLIVASLLLLVSLRRVDR